MIIKNFTFFELLDYQMITYFKTLFLHLTRFLADKAANLHIFTKSLSHLIFCALITENFNKKANFPSCDNKYLKFCVFVNKALKCDRFFVTLNYPQKLNKKQGRLKARASTKNQKI